MASVSITNIQSGMTVGTTFVAYGQFDISQIYLDTSPLVRASMAIGTGTYGPSSYQQSVDSSGLHGYWQAGFSGLPTGNHCVLTASLHVPTPPPAAQATELTVGDGVVSVGPIVNPPPPPSKSPDPEKLKVAKSAAKVKRQFSVGGTYTPGPQDIVIAYVRKNGTQRGESTVHGLNSSTKKWEDTVNANAGEIGTDYAIIVELQHNAQRIATCALLGVELEN